MYHSYDSIKNISVDFMAQTMGQLQADFANEYIGGGVLAGIVIYRLNF